jgi:hypothetical protein
MTRMGGLLCVAVLLLGGAASAAPAESTRATMQRVYGALSTLLPAALTPGGWEDPARRNDVQGSLEALASAADQLSQHAGLEAQSFVYFSQSLGTDAREIQRRVSARRFEAASYLTQRMLETCVACHTRLPATSAAAFSGGLLQRLDQTSLSPLMRARLKTATRQFDDALTTYEEAFGSAAEADPLLEYEVPSYLIVALRVRREPARAERGLALLARRSDLTGYFAQQLPGWRESLRELAPTFQEKPSLARARALLASGRARSEFPADGADVVHAIAASSMTYRYLEQAKPQGRELAEALYLLGQTEAFTRRSFELSDAQHYLEQVIRTAPHSALAERAYGQLERAIVFGYTGSAGENVPADVRAQLRALQELSRVSGAR